MNYLYESTRSEKLTSTPSNAILKGLSDDGGLFVLKDIKNLSVDIESLKGKTYYEIAETVISKLLSDFSMEQINACVHGAYENKFSSEDITPLVKVGDDYILELFKGPTSAFKDVGLSILPHFMTTAMKINNVEDEVVILTATSGDTGKAALEGFKDVEGTSIIVFYPKEGVSKVQERQMVTTEGNNTFVGSIYGNFDDAQSGVKKIFTNKEFLAEQKEKGIVYSSANSINIGRLIPQMVYYFKAYADLMDRNEVVYPEKVDFVVPTGNFGNILAGYFAKLLGLPVGTLVCASNENNVLTDFLNEGVYDRNRPFHKTISPSMDILISSNLERLLYYMSGCDNAYVKQCMDSLNSTGKYAVTDEIKEKIQKEFFGGCATNTETSFVIKKVYEEKGYLLDPHTAVAYKVMEDFKTKNNANKCVVLSTASPYKFTKDVYEAVFGKTDMEEFVCMKELNKKTGVDIPNNLKDLESKPVLHNASMPKEDMIQFVSDCKKGN